MPKKRRRRTPSSQKPQNAPTPRWSQLAILGAVLLLVVTVLVLKNRATDPPTALDSQPQATATLPEAVSQIQATAELQQVVSPASDTTLADELPEAQLDRLITAGQPTLAFFHSNNCVQCLKMMDVVAQVYPEFRDAVALVDVNVYDQRNVRLLQRAGIRAIPTQIFFGRTRQGLVVMGAMTAEQFREQMQKLAGGQ